MTSADQPGVYLTHEEHAALLAERDALRAAQSYTYIGKDGKPILARDLEDQRDALEAQVEGAAAIIATERAEVLRLREENQRLQRAHNFTLAQLVADGKHLTPEHFGAVADGVTDCAEAIRCFNAEQEKNDD